MKKKSSWAPYGCGALDAWTSQGWDKFVNRAIAVATFSVPVLYIYCGGLAIPLP